jgi:hypothetical protein
MAQPNKAVNPDAQVRPHAARAPVLVRRLPLRYAAGPRVCVGASGVVKSCATSFVQKLWDVRAFRANFRP